MWWHAVTTKQISEYSSDFADTHSQPTPSIFIQRRHHLLHHRNCINSIGPNFYLFSHFWFDLQLSEEALFELLVDLVKELILWTFCIHIMHPHFFVLNNNHIVK